MELKCDDVVPGLGCDFVATGANAQVAKDAMMAHGAEVHSDLMEGKSPEEAEAASAEMGRHIEQLIDTAAND